MTTPFDLGGMPPELAAQAQALMRRRALAEALLGRSLQPLQAPQSQGRIAARMSPLQPIVQVLQAGLSARGLKGADTEMLGLGQQYKDLRQKAVQDYIAKRTGAPMEGAMSAATSDFPVLQELGKADLLQQMKSGVTMEDILKLPYSSASKVAAVEAQRRGDPNWFTLLKPEAKTTAIGGQIVETTEGQAPKPLGYFGEEWADGRPEPYQRNLRSGELKKLDQAPKITTQVGVSGFTKKVPEELAKKAADRLDALGKQVSGAESAVASINTLEQLDKEGIFTNRTAAGETLLNNIAQRIGMKVDTERLARTETYSSEVAKLWLAAMESVTGGARGLTEKETDELKKLQPQIQNSPQTRQRIYKIYRDGAARLRQQFGRAMEGVKTALTADDPGKLVDALGQMYTMEEPFGPALTGMEAPTNAPLNVETIQPLPAPTPLAPPKPQGRLRPY